MAKKNEVKGEIPSITILTTTAAINAKINEVKGKPSNITNLATTTALNAVKNKIPSVNNLVKETGCNTEVSKIENKTTDRDYNLYITLPEFNKLTVEKFAPTLAQANLASRSEIW